MLTKCRIPQINARRLAAEVRIEWEARKLGGQAVGQKIVDTLELLKNRFVITDEHGPWLEEAMEIAAPKPNAVLASIANVQAHLAGEQSSIAEWRARYQADLVNAWQRADAVTFNSFVNCLLERATPGEAWVRRGAAMQRIFHSLGDVTEENARNVLSEVGYRFPKVGVGVILAASQIVAEDAFTWQRYVEQAEQHYKTDFQKDPFLAIKGVKFKTRDLALSELSDRFVAVDLHVVRVTTRTGLLLHGYGDPRISTNVNSSEAYLFFHDLMLRLSRRTGWPESGYSPGEMDRMLRHFGRTICRATPVCKNCPLAGTCLTRTAQV